MSKLTFFQDYFIQDFRKNCPDVSIGGSKAKDTAENVLQSKMQGQLKSDDLAVISNKECAEYVWVNVLLNDFKVINDLKQLADQLGITTQLKTNIDAYTNYLYTSRGDIPAKDVSSFIQRWGEVLELGFKPDAVFGWKYSGSSQEQEDSKNAAFVTLTLPIPSLEASVNLATLKGMVKRATKDLQDNFHALTQLRVVTDHSIMKILNNDNKADVTQYNNLLEQIKLLNTNPVSIETKLNGLNQTLYEDGKTFLGVNASTALKKALRNDKLIGETSEYQATAASSADAPESGVVEQMLKAARKNDESLRSQATPGQPTDSADAPESGVVEQMLKAARKKADDKGNNGSSDSWYDKLNLFPSSSSESQEKPTQKVVGVGLSQIGGEIRANFYNGIFKFIKTASIASQDSTLK